MTHYIQFVRDNGGLQRIADEFEAIVGLADHAYREKDWGSSCSLNPTFSAKKYRPVSTGLWTNVRFAHSSHPTTMMVSVRQSSPSTNSRERSTRYSLSTGSVIPGEAMV